MGVCPYLDGGRFIVGGAAEYPQLPEVGHDEVRVFPELPFLWDHHERGLERDVQLHLFPVSHGLLQAGRRLGFQLLPRGRGCLGQSERREGGRRGERKGAQTSASAKPIYSLRLTTLVR